MNLNSNLFVGMIENYTYTDEIFELEKGTKLFLYTDGVTEAENMEAELYGEEQLEKAVTTCASESLSIMVNTVIRSINDHVKEADPSDDLTIFIIHYKPEINKSDHENRERNPINE